MSTTVHQPAQRARRAFSRLTSLAASAVLLGGLCASAMAQVQTATTLTASSPNPAQGQPVTLTATISNATKGEVGFCDITLTSHCLSSDLFAIRQISASGVASVVITPSVGLHQYRATYVGNTASSLSFNSTPVPVQVAGPYATTTTLVSNGNSSLTATVLGSGSQSVTPSGIVNFVSNGKNVGSGTLGAGSFSQSYIGVTSTLTGSFTVVATADLNNDGYTDVVLQNGTTIVPAFGGGAGTFAMGTPFTASMNATRVLVYDFNSDGSNDILVSSATGSALYANNGSGVFSASGTSTLQAMTLGDFNYDGIPDIAGPAVGNSSAIQYAYGSNGSFTLAPAAIPVANGASITDMMASDVNGDPVLDLVVVGTNSSNAPTAWTLVTGSASVKATPLSGAAAPIKVAAIDFNNDKIQDIAVLSANGITFALGQNSGVVGSTNVPASTGIYAVGNTTPATGNTLSTADLNSDSRPDFVVGGSAGTTIYFGTGGAGSAGSTLLSTSASTGVALGDVNADGMLDIITVAGSSTVTAYENILGSQASVTANVTPPCVGSTACNTSITAAYGGDSNFGKSTSSPVSISVQPYSDAISANSVSTNTNQTSVQLGAAVSYSNSTAPTGAITFQVLNSSNAVVLTQAGVCSPQGSNTLGCDTVINPSTLGTGTYKVIASLSKDTGAGQYPAITSDPNANGTLTISAAATPTVVITKSTYPSTGGSFSLNSTITGSSGGSAPTGAIIYTLDGVPQNVSCTFSGNAQNCSISYTFTPAQAAMSHTLTVSIAANGSYNAASATSTLTATTTTADTLTLSQPTTQIISAAGGANLGVLINYSNPDGNGNINTVVYGLQLVNSSNQVAFSGQGSIIFGSCSATSATTGICAYSVNLNQSIPAGSYTLVPFTSNNGYFTVTAANAVVIAQ